MGVRLTKTDLSYLITAVLIVSVTATLIMGLVAAASDLNRFVYHKYSAYITAALAYLHLFLHWPRFATYVRFRLGGRPTTVAVLERQISPSTGPIPPRREFLRSALFLAGGFLLGKLVPLGRIATLQAGQDLGEIYHQWSKPSYWGVLTKPLDWGLQPALYKRYSGSNKLYLPKAWGADGLSLEKAIDRRRSHRNFSGRPLPLAHLSRLLHYAMGITQRQGALRAAPSAGALYPIELYVVVNNVEGLKQGIYHYSVADHSLEELKLGDHRLALVQAAVGQEMVGQGNASFVFTAVSQRTRWKYGERSYRYIMLEAGHIAQNIYLAATSLGLGACAVGAFFDDDVNRLLEIDGVNEATIYLVAVGTL